MGPCVEFAESHEMKTPCVLFYCVVYKQLKDRGVDERIILIWIFEKWDGGHGLDRCRSG
jgi:hypothetical protein